MLICLFVVFIPGHGCSKGHSEDLAMGVFGILEHIPAFRVSGKLQSF
jgi:hypothetical protein